MWGVNSRCWGEQLDIEISARLPMMSRWGSIPVVGISLTGRSAQAEACGSLSGGYTAYALTDKKEVDKLVKQDPLIVNKVCIYESNTWMMCQAVPADGK